MHGKRRNTGHYQSNGRCGVSAKTKMQLTFANCILLYSWGIASSLPSADFSQRQLFLSPPLWGGFGWGCLHLIHRIQVPLQYIAYHTAEGQRAGHAVYRCHAVAVAGVGLYVGYAVLHVLYKALGYAGLCVP